MCLHNTTPWKEVSKENAITVYKIVISKRRTYFAIYQDYYVYNRGEMATSRPGFHAFLNKKEAKAEMCPGSSAEKLIKVKLWGWVRYGTQFSRECIAGTRMEIKSFENIARNHRRKKVEI